MANTYKGKYKVKNRGKYNGNADDVVYRSGWEKQVMIFLDENTAVEKWNSEVAENLRRQEQEKAGTSSSAPQ